MSDPSPLPEFMTVAEIAAILRLNQQTIRNWIDAGKLPCYRIGERRVRIDKRDFDAFMAAAAEKPMPPSKPGAIWDGEMPDPV